jgi:[ribosomal protein S5]-alanine N-acetyltransferase
LPTNNAPSLQAFEIQTERLVLRPWRTSDVDDAFAYGSDPEWGYYLWETPHPYLRAHAEQFVAASAQNPPGSNAQFAVTLANQAIGGVRLYMLDAHSGVAGMGYNIARAHWGKGFATEAASAVLAAAFERFGVRKVIAHVDARNIGSIRVLQKLGMQQEAVLRQQRLFRGEYVDEVWYAALRDPS